MLKTVGSYRQSSSPENDRHPHNLAGSDASAVAATFVELLRSWGLWWQHNFSGNGWLTHVSNCLHC